MASDKPKTRKLCVRLLKEGLAPVDAMKDGHGLEERPWTANPNAILYTGVSQPFPPKWAEFIEEGCGVDLTLKSQNSGALLFISVSERWLVLAFGYGFQVLTGESYEPNFGLRCALNSVEPEALKSIDISTPEQTTIQRRIQTSQATELGVFGVATEKDILKKLQGRAKDEDFAKNITGADALTLTAPLHARELHEKCSQIMEVYAQTTYKERFAWVDHIGLVKDKVKCTELDELLVSDLSGDSAAAHLAQPEIVDPESLEQFRFQGVRSRDTFPDLMLDQYLRLVREQELVLSVDILKQDKVVAVQDDNTEYAKWSVYRCLVYEAEKDGLLFVLSGGNWYQVERSFAAEVNAIFDRAVPGPGLPDATDNDNEDTYIPRIRSQNQTWACLHTRNVKCDNWSSPIEPCDFLTSEREFLHIKNSSSSSTLSHLFSQGTVAAEAFKREAEFRKRVNDNIIEANSSFASPFINHEESITSGDYAVVFAVMRKPYRNGAMALPFFSKVAYRDAKRRLDDLGFQTKFSWIRKPST